MSVFSRVSYYVGLTLSSSSSGIFPLPHDLCFSKTHLRGVPSHVAVSFSTFRSVPFFFSAAFRLVVVFPFALEVLHGTSTFLVYLVRFYVTLILEVL